MSQPKYSEKSNRGQGLIEFALIMPILLLMVMGIIDFGRMFYIYSAASNAVREAVRIGAVDPANCAAIEQAARSQVTFIPQSSFTVTIGYDDGMNPKAFACPPQVTDVLAPGKDRVVVTVDAVFSPLTPIISNMFPSLGLNYQAGRTISFAPGVSAPPPGAVPPPPPPPAPVVSLSCSPTNGGAPLTVVCTASAPGYTVNSWSWSPAPASGQGTTVVTYTFSSVGANVVTVTGSNTGGSGSASATITVNAGPTANFSCNTHVVNTGVNVTCTDASSNAPTSGTWTWGDGGTTNWTGVGSTVSHAYATSGARNILLSVSNANGSSTATWNVTVYNPVNVTAVTCTPSSGNSPLAVSCTATVSGDAISYQWDWGDSSGATAGNPGTHTFSPAASASFSVTVTAYGWGGGSSSRSTMVSVNVPPVGAAFTCTPLAGSYPFQVTCTDQSSGNPTAWSWNFGDGSTTSAQNPVHSYNAGGIYTVTLTASKVGSSSTLSKPSYITSVKMSISNYQVCASDNNNADIYVHATLTNTLKLPIASGVVTDTTTGVRLTSYGNNQYCAKVATGTGKKGDVHNSTAVGWISGVRFSVPTSDSAVYDTGTCPITCP